MSRFGTGGGRRSGAHELGNLRAGAYDIIGIELQATYEQGKATYDENKATYDENKGKISQAIAAYKAITAKTPDEQYLGTNWDPSSVLAGDAGFQELRKMLDAEAKLSADTRAAREAVARDAIAGYFAAASLAFPALAVVGVVVVAAFEAANAVWKMGQDDLDAQQWRDAAVANTQTLWDRWRMISRKYEPDFEFAYNYAAYLDRTVKNMDSTEPGPAEPGLEERVVNGPAPAGVGVVGPAWRAQWVAMMDWALTPSAPAAVRDLFRNRLLPIVAPPRESVRTTDPAGEWHEFPDLNFGECQNFVRHKGTLSAARDNIEWGVCALTLDQMRSIAARQAAAIAILVTSYLNRDLARPLKVPLEKVIEDTYLASQKIALEVGPQPYKRAWLIKGIFEAALQSFAAAKEAKSLSMARIADVVLTAQRKKQNAINLANALEKTHQEYVARAAAAKPIIPPSSVVMKSKLEDRGLFELVKLWHARKMTLPAAPSKT